MFNVLFDDNMAIDSEMPSGMCCNVERVLENPLWNDDAPPYDEDVPLGDDNTLVVRHR